MIIHKGTFTVILLENDTRYHFPSLREAKNKAARIVGNNSYAKPWPEEDTYFYGPGDGTTSVIVREDVEFAQKEPA